MRFDIKTASPEEQEAVLRLRIFDVITGAELRYIEAFDTEQQWRREIGFDANHYFTGMREIIAPLRLEWPEGVVPEIFTR